MILQKELENSIRTFLLESCTSNVASRSSLTTIYNHVNARVNQIERFQFIHQLSLINILVAVINDLFLFAKFKKVANKTFVYGVKFSPPSAEVETP